MVFQLPFMSSRHLWIRRPRRSDAVDGGYVLALGALAMVPLLAATGFAVDVGAWYARAGQLQKVADAAALGGVVWLPDSDAAESAARAVLARNGFPDDDGDGTVDGTEVTIEFSYPGPQQLGVSLHDGDVDVYFARVVLEDMQIERRGVAEYVLPLALGSPRNFLGTGSDPADVLPAELHENFWLAVSGPCASRENGELYAAVSDGNYHHDAPPHDANPGVPGASISWQGCRAPNAVDLTGDDPEDTYDPDGYFFAVEVPPAGAGRDLTIDVYDAPHCSTGGRTGESRNSPEGVRYRSSFTVRRADSTPYVPMDNPVVAQQSFESDQDVGGCGSAADDWQARNDVVHRGWRTLATITDAAPGLHFVQVQTSDGISDEAYHQSNVFALRAGYASSWTPATSPCSADPADTIWFDDRCPQVYAVDHMGVFANLTSSVPSFFLTSVGDEHSGKTLEVELWDAGEGAQAIEILDPLGRSVDFSWEVRDLSGTDDAPTGGWSGDVDQVGPDPFCDLAHPGCRELDVLGTPNTHCVPSQPCWWRGWNPQPDSYRGSRSKYSDRLLHLEIDLPDDIATAYGGATWWRVRYTMGPVRGANVDRTTWSVAVEGDPVRLLE